MLLRKIDQILITSAIIPVSVFSIGLIDDYGVMISASAGIMSPLYPKMFYNELDYSPEWQENIYATNLNLELQYNRFFVTESVLFASRSAYEKHEDYYDEYIYQSYTVFDNSLTFEYAFLKSSSYAFSAIGGIEITRHDFNTLFVADYYQSDLEYRPVGIAFTGGAGLRFSLPYTGIRTQFKFVKYDYSINDIVSVWEARLPLTIMIGKETFGGLVELTPVMVHASKSEDIEEEVSGNKFGLNVMSGAYLMLP
ncbi:MAG: hypothetical protein DRH51_06930 [Candidatus Coatesbacteria bacterium]|nr:MAG: hypothetical protein DRH51_06930 [Candidatus Coatesbacteria bacterium]